MGTGTSSSQATKKVSNGDRSAGTGRGGSQCCFNDHRGEIHLRNRLWGFPRLRTGYDSFCCDLLSELQAHFIVASHVPIFQLYHVDSIAPEYSQYVPLNMYLLKLEERCHQHYYRSPASMMSDARLIYTNCVWYNTESAALTLKAAELFRSIVRDVTLAFPLETFSDYFVFDRMLTLKEPYVALVKHARVCEW
jgi:Bromodomain